MKGHSGWRITLVMARLIMDELNAQQPDIIILMIGTNDMIVNFGVIVHLRLSALIDQITNLFT